MIFINFLRTILCTRIKKTSCNIRISVKEFWRLNIVRNIILIVVEIIFFLAFIVSCERSKSAIQDFPKENTSNITVKNSVETNRNIDMQVVESKTIASDITKTKLNVLVSLEEQISGTWIKEGESECFCGQCLEIQFKKQVDDFCVEDNQIFVSAIYRLDVTNRKVNIFFKNPTDLGVGGGKLPWAKFSRKEPIAIIDISNLNENLIKVKWIGFTLRGKASRGKYNFGSWYQGIYRKK